MCYTSMKTYICVPGSHSHKKPDIGMYTYSHSAGVGEGRKTHGACWLPARLKSDELWVQWEIFSRGNKAERTKWSPIPSSVSTCVYRYVLMCSHTHKHTNPIHIEKHLKKTNLFFFLCSSIIQTPVFLLTLCKRQDAHVTASQMYDSTWIVKMAHELVIEEERWESSDAYIHL